MEREAKMYLIPEPKLCVREGGTFRIGYRSKIVTAPGSSAADSYAKLLAEDFEKRLGFLPARTRGKCGGGSIYLCCREELSPQEYELTINQEGIVIAGGDDCGILYGVQTLRQIVAQFGAKLPCLKIQDKPDIENRGFYHDAARGRIPTLDTMKAMADRMAYYKMNQLQLYIEHSYLFEGLSEVWRDDTPLTAEEIMELDQYCRGLGIELVPSLSSFGHLYKLLSTMGYRHLCELEDFPAKPFSFTWRMQHHTIDVSNPDSLELIKGMIAEFLPLFSSEQFNICGDETFDLGRGRSKGLAEEIGKEEMYVQFVGRLCEFILEQGKRPMFWGDVICGFPEAVQKLPKETICLNWGYAPKQSEESTQKLAEAGAVQYCCPGAAGWNYWVNLIEPSYENIRRMCSYAVKYHAIGVLNTDWGDFGHINHPDFSIVGMIYGAAFSWNSNIPEFDEINRQISALEFGDSKETMVSVIAQANSSSVFSWHDTVQYKEACEQQKSEEERAEILKRSDFTTTVECSKRLDQWIDDLYGKIAELTMEKRSLVKPYIIAGEGMKIWNRIGDYIAAKVYGQKASFYAASGEKTEASHNCGCGEADKKIYGAYETARKALAATNPEAEALASELETWFYHYKELWRSVSKEAEMYRVSDVVMWYGDYLRSL